MSTLTEIINDWFKKTGAEVKRLDTIYNKESVLASNKAFLLELLVEYYEGEEIKESLVETLYKLSQINESYSLKKIDDHYLIDTLREYIVERDMK